MKLAAYATLLASGVFTVSDYLPSSEMLQGTALAILGCTIWYVLVKAFPAHLRAMQQARKDFLAAQADMRHDFKESLDRVSLSIDRMAIVLDEFRK